MISRTESNEFPKRKVVSVRPARADNQYLQCYVMLECGHEVGVKPGFEVPKIVPCYLCHKIAINAAFRI